jgi:hypothetical protein
MKFQVLFSRRILFYLFAFISFKPCYSQEMNNKELLEKISLLEKKLKQLDEKVDDIKSSTDSKNLKDDLLKQFDKISKNFDKVENIIDEKENKGKELIASAQKLKEAKFKIDSLVILNNENKERYNRKLIDNENLHKESLNKLNQEVDQKIKSLEDKILINAKILSDLDNKSKDWNEDSLVNIRKAIVITGKNSSTSIRNFEDYITLLEHLSRGKYIMTRGFSSIIEIRDYKSGLTTMKEKYRAFPKLLSEYEKVSILIGLYEDKVKALDNLFKVVIADRASSLEYKKANALKQMHSYSDYPYLIQLIKAFSSNLEKNPLEGKLR